MAKRMDTGYDRLALQALETRNALRRVVPLLNHAILNGDPSGVLTMTRDLAWKHADALRLALKHPAAGQPRSVSSEPGRLVAFPYNTANELTASKRPSRTRSTTREVAKP